MHTVWVTGEIAEISESRGNHYLDIVQKDEETGQIVAKSTAVIWLSDYQKMYQKVGFQLENLLRSGIKVLVEVKVEYHERYGLKYVIRNIDPVFTIGQLETERQQTLLTLKRSGLLVKNKETHLPMVPQRIAVISSEYAAGLQDFLQQLKENPYGYQFICTLLNTRMQGENVRTEITKRFKEIVAKQEAFDVVVIIRGGGAKLDLIAFDDLETCQLAAQCPLPILTGIGHDTDDTILDQVAYHASKTPTAVADFLIERALQFAETLNRLTGRLQMSVQQQIALKQLTVQQLTQRLQYSTVQRLTNQQMMLDYMKEQIPKTVSTRLTTEQQGLQLITKQLKLLSPEFALRRGFTITTKNGQPIQAETLQSGDEITTQSLDGIIQSIVK